MLYEIKASRYLNVYCLFNQICFSHCVRHRLILLTFQEASKKKLARRKAMPPTATKGTSGHRVQKFAFSTIKPFLITLTPALEKCKNKSTKAVF